MTEYFGRFIGTSAAIQKTYRKIKNIAPSNRPVLITGEVGTGKNICAEAIHFYSHHHNKKFITFNCLQDAQLEIKEKESTLFLDQILKAPQNKRKSILDFLKNIGIRQSNDFNTRIICSAQSDLYKTPQQQEFLKQLKTRLNYFLIEIPPLRERKGDLVNIAHIYLEEYSKAYRKNFSGFSDSALNLMKDYLWPENISEMRKTIKQIISQERGNLITAAMLPPKIKQTTSKTHQTKHNDFQHISIPLWQIEKDAIERIIRLCKGDIVQAANILEISPSTIYRKIQKWEKISS